ncbi:DsbA family protein [Providencia rettgeri]
MRHWKRWGGESQLRQDLYTAVINDKLDLANKDVLNQWLKRHNIDSTQYLKTSESQAVQERLKNMLEISKFYQITGTPAFIINKRYVVYQDRDFADFTAYMLELLDKSNKELR